jgi:hypothetical protein
MSLATLKSICWRLPAWAAFMLGLGALSAGTAQADRSPLQPPETTPEPSSSAMAPRPDTVSLKIDGGKVYISQGGSRFEELRLGDTAEATHLRRLLQDVRSAGQPVSVPVGSIIVGSGGGSGSGAKPKQHKGK